MRKGIGIFLVFIVMMMLVWPVSAQDGLSDEELEQVEFVSQAFDNFNALNSYQMAGQQETSATLVMEDAPFADQKTVSVLEIMIEVDADGIPQTLYGNIAADMTVTGMLGEPMAFSMVSDVILLDGDYYLRFDMNGEFVEEAIPQEFSGMWFVISLDELLGQLEEATGMGDLDVNELLQTASPTSDYMMPVNPESVRSIVEGDSETLDGQEMRVFTIEIDYANAIPEPMQELFDMLMGGLPNQGMAVDFESMIDIVSQRVSVYQIVWVGVDDNLPHRIDLTSEGEIGEALESMLGVGITYDFANSSSINFSNFDEPVEVETPPDAVPLIDGFPGGF